MCIVFLTNGVFLVRKYLMFFSFVDALAMFKNNMRVKRYERVSGHVPSGTIKYSTSGRVNKLLIYEGHKYIRNNMYGANIYWKCTKWHNGCKARAITNNHDPTLCLLKNVHSHPPKQDDIFNLK